MHQGDVVQLAHESCPVGGKDIHLPLEVIPAFCHGSVFEQGLEILATTLGKLEGFPLRCSRDDPPCLCEYTSVGTLHYDRAYTGLPGCPGNFERGYSVDIQVFLFFLRDGRGISEITFQGVELVFLEQVRQLRSIGLVHLHFFGAYSDLDVRLDGDEFVTEPDMAFRLLEHRFLLRGEFVQMLVYSFDRAVSGHQFAGTDFSDPLYSRDVVGRVSADGQHLDDLERGLDPVFGAYLLHAQDLVVSSCLARLVLPDMVFDQLAVVLVGSYHVHVQSFGCASLGCGTDHVVGFESRHHQGRDIHCLAKLH